MSHSRARAICWLPHRPPPPFSLSLSLQVETIELSFPALANISYSTLDPEGVRGEGQGGECKQLWAPHRVQLLEQLSASPNLEGSEDQLGESKEAPGKWKEPCRGAG